MLAEISTGSNTPWHGRFGLRPSTLLRGAQRRSLPDINEYVAHHNRDTKPFIWTNGARDILQEVIQANRRLSRKQNETLHLGAIARRRRALVRLLSLLLLRAQLRAEHRNFKDPQKGQ